MKTKVKLQMLTAMTLLLSSLTSVGAIDLLEQYPTKLTDGDAVPQNARTWEFKESDVYRLSRFKLEAGRDLRLESGPADLGIAHCGDGAVWAVVIPSDGGKLASSVAKEEVIAHVWLRFHPKEITRIFPPDTVTEGGATNLMNQMRAIADVKFRSSWHAGMRAMIPAPKDITVDVDTKGGPRRFFMVNTVAGTAEYVAAFEERSVQPARTSLATAPPVVVKTVPTAGTTNADPTLTEIRVSFSKPMSDGSWSWSTWGEENYPETTGSPKYLADNRTCVLPVKLQPRRFYAIWLNSDNFKNFKDASGRPAVPYLLTFFTGDHGDAPRLGSDISAEHGVGKAIADKIRSEVTAQFKKSGARFDALRVSVAEMRDSGTPFKVSYQGLRDFNTSSGKKLAPPDGSFVMNYAGGGVWQGELGGVSFAAQVGNTDKIDLPFVTDPQVIGEWVSVDFVSNASEFKPGKRAWSGDLFLKNLVFLENGKCGQPWWTWTKGLVIHSGDKTASRYEIREINGQSYMFFEWKSGDVTILGREPSYYVLTKSSSTAAKGTSVERILNKLVSEFPAAEDLSTPEGACAAWQRANVRKDAKAICAMSLTPLDPKEQENWFLRVEQADAEGFGVYLKALAESKIVLVQVWRNELANVITFLPFPEGKGREPYSARFFGLVNGAWKNLGEDRLPNLDSAKADFENKKERMWQRFTELKAKAISPAPSQSQASDSSLALLNEDQRAVLAWTDRQFRSYFDARAFQGWSEKERSELETRLIDSLSGPQSREYYQAINTLGAMRSEKALPKLRQIAFDRADKNNRDRWMAIRSLGLMGDTASVPELIHLLYHGNQNTHWWAQISLVRLTGQNFGKDWNAWGKWWNDQKSQPPFNPAIIRWWSGQPEALAELVASLDESDQKFLQDVKK